jgi:hypothetical protein
MLVVLFFHSVLLLVVHGTLSLTVADAREEAGT